MNKKLKHITIIGLALTATIGIAGGLGSEVYFAHNNAHEVRLDETHQLRDNLIKSDVARNNALGDEKNSVSQQLINSNAVNPEDVKSGQDQNYALNSFFVNQSYMTYYALIAPNGDNNENTGLPVYTDRTITIKPNLNGDLSGLGAGSKGSYINPKLIYISKTQRDFDNQNTGYQSLQESGWKYDTQKDSNGNITALTIHVPDNTDQTNYGHYVVAYKIGQNNQDMEAQGDCVIESSGVDPNDGKTYYQSQPGVPSMEGIREWGAWYLSKTTVNWKVENQPSSFMKLAAQDLKPLELVGTPGSKEAIMAPEHYKFVNNQEATVTIGSGKDLTADIEVTPGEQEYDHFTVNYKTENGSLAGSKTYTAVPGAQQTINPPTNYHFSDGSIAKDITIQSNGSKDFTVIPDHDEASESVPTNENGGHQRKKNTAKSPSRVFAYKAINLYRHSKLTGKKFHFKKTKRALRPVFIVKKTVMTKNGTLRYYVKQLHHRRYGWISGNPKLVGNLYYNPSSKARKIRVIAPKGINVYKTKGLKNKKRHYRKGAILKTKKVVSNGNATRFQLAKHAYVSASKKFVILK